MDPVIRSTLVSFLIAIFPVLQVYLVLLLKEQISKFHQSTVDVATKVDAAQATIDAVAAAQAKVAVDLAAANNSPVSVPAIPPAQGNK